MDFRTNAVNTTPLVTSVPTPADQPRRTEETERSKAHAHLIFQGIWVQAGFSRINLSLNKHVGERGHGKDSHSSTLRSKYLSSGKELTTLTTSWLGGGEWWREGSEASWISGEDLRCATVPMNTMLVIPKPYRLGRFPYVCDFSVSLNILNFLNIVTVAV